MQDYRRFSFPIAHLVSEVISAPLTSEISLQKNITHLDPRLKNEKTQALWRKVEYELARSFPNTSLDELVHYRDLFWFGHLQLSDSAYHAQHVSLFNFMQRLPEICHGQGAEDDPFAAFKNTYLLKLWLSFALPADLLAHFNMPNLSEPLHPALSHILADNGYAETHVHIGASFNFPLLWSAGMRNVATISLANMQKAFHSPGAYFNEGRELGYWLILCGFARIILAKYLVRPAQKKSQTFTQYVEEELITDLQAMTYDNLSSGLPHMLINSLEMGTLPDDIILSDINGLYGAMIHHLGENHPGVYTFEGERVESVLTDPISLIHPIYESLYPEPVFLQKGFEHLKNCAEQGCCDDTFEQIFWQVLRIRCMTYRYMIQRPMTPGLQWFIRHFGRLKPFKEKISNQERIKQAIDYAKHKDGLKSLELRTLHCCPEEIWEIMEATWEEIGPMSTDDDDATAKKIKHLPETCEIGWVFHFIRDRGGGFRQGTLSGFGIGQASDPAQEENSAFRFGNYSRQALTQANQLARFLILYPASLTLIRGIDACNDEIGIPNWVLMPAFTQVMKGVDIARQAYKRHYKVEAPAFHKTIHTGEDFVHLATGLRKIYESIQCFKLRQGDRLGHALALGINCDLWFEAVGTVPMTIETRLFDLCWERLVIQNMASPALAARNAYLENTIVELGQEFFQCEDLDLHCITHWYQWLHSPEHLQWAGFPPIKHSFGLDSFGDSATDRDIRARSRRLLDRYLHNIEVHRRGQQVRLFDIHNIPLEKEATQFLQNYLRHKISALELTVEVNPTSNLLVANLADLKYHPLWQFKSPDTATNVQDVSICIGSDDPTIFATSICLEYQTLYESLILSGITNEAAFKWIDDIRKTGLNARFTLPRNECKDPFEWENVQGYGELALFN